MDCETWKEKSTTWETLNTELHDQMCDMNRSVENELRKELDLVNAKLKFQLEQNERLQNQLSRVGIDDVNLRVHNENAGPDSAELTGTEIVPYGNNIASKGTKDQEPCTHTNSEEPSFEQIKDKFCKGTLPTFHLLTQPTSTPSPKKCSDSELGPTWLTQFSEELPKAIDMLVESQNLKNKEKLSMQKMKSNDLEIRNMSETLDATVVKKVPPSDDDFEDGPSTLERIEQRDRNSIPAKRTPSQKMVVTPTADEKMDVVSKGYKHCHPYLNMSKVAKDVVDRMAKDADTSG